MGLGYKISRQKPITMMATTSYPVTQNLKRTSRRKVKTPTPFIRFNSKAVFLSGLRPLDGPAYDEYRTRCYKDIQKYKVGKRQIYVTKFDFPRNKTSAFLHVQTTAMAEHLKTQGTLKLAGDDIKAYDYAPSQKRIDEESRLATPLKTPSRGTSPRPGYDSVFDSGMNSESEYLTPAKIATLLKRRDSASSVGSRHSSICESMPINRETTAPAAPPVTRQQSTRYASEAASSDADYLHAKLEQLQTDRMKEIMDKIELPIPYGAFFPAEYFQLKMLACQRVMSGELTEEEFSRDANAKFDQIVLPIGLIHFSNIDELRARAFHGVMSHAFTVQEFNSHFAAIFHEKMTYIYNDFLTKEIAA